jgi:(S)-3,5-dihydroxyphenylglycine transaminase
VDFQLDAGFEALRSLVRRMLRWHAPTPACATWMASCRTEGDGDVQALTAMNSPLSLPADRLNTALSNPKLEVMNFLNEVAMRFPQAISFAPGRPPERFFDVARTLPLIDEFMRDGDLSALHRPDIHGLDALGQYGRTNGIIGSLIAKLLATDEDIHVRAQDIVITVGAQEAMCLCLRTLCGNPGDVALTIDPAYIGFSGAAQTLGVEVVGVPCGQDGIDLNALKRIAAALELHGKSARVLYLSSSYANPTGSTLSVSTRRRLLELARELNLLLLEDSAYSYFCYDDVPLPSLKSMAGGERVLYLGSFAKTLAPGLRLGFIVADQEVDHGAGRTTRLADEISKAKSLLTVNTSAVLQALAGGLLLSQDCSLRSFVAPRVRALKGNRDAMLAALDTFFPKEERWCRGISWNRPAGGFFLTITLPGPVGEHDLLRCAGEHAVTWTPMSSFLLGSAPSAQIRLSFSYVTAPEIHEGIRRLASWARGCQWNSPGHTPNLQPRP